MGSTDRFYGKIRQTVIGDQIDRCAEEVRLLGFSVLEGIIPKNELENFRNQIDKVYRIQEEEFGRDDMAEISELNVARALLVYDEYFLKMIVHETIQKIVKLFLGDYFIINLQNAIISLPNEPHHQSSWHRDLPYQNFVISQPIAINAFYCIDDFSSETGGTELIPYTHKMETLPSDDFIGRHKVALNCPAGSVVIFDSMLLHRAGFNSSRNIRRGVNHIFSVPIMKQQYDFPAMLKGKFSEDPFLNRLLGYDCQTPLSVVEWRKHRLARLRT
ncbi:MAG: phytanoyl-CoA dioxygenase family protein [Nitrospinae bacterium]|nr:phytanoyl-CoA dioxygenase family protein [Nitrospinota bacterium]